jgi:hypothetical protein
MSKKLIYTVDLTEDEAIALVLLKHSGGSSCKGFAADQVNGIASALEDAARHLQDAQFRKWKALDRPHYSLDSIDLTEDDL